MKITENYFYFTRAELRAGLLLLVLVCIVRFLPYWVFPERHVQTDFSALMALDSLQKSKGGESIWSNTSEHGALNDVAPIPKAFKFDPNTATASQFKALGFKPYLAERIVKYRQSGAVFRSKEDLLKVYGMDTQRLKAIWSSITLPAGHMRSNRATELAHQVNSTSSVFAHPYKPVLVDLNTTDTNALIALPGIGSKLANRIIAYRDKLGGFFNLEQLYEVYGLKPETIQLILPRLSTLSPVFRFLYLNQADRETIGSHPYIGYRAANAIIAYRQQHGPFTSIEDINKTLLFSQNQALKLNNYVKF